jgi:transcriptional regulator with XRE-family HTH domain
LGSAEEKADKKAELIIKRVRQCCDRMGQRGFAKLAGVNDAYLSRLLAGTRSPTKAMLARLTEGLDVAARQAEAGQDSDQVDMLAADDVPADRGQNMPTGPMEGAGQTGEAGDHSTSA